MRTAHAQHAIPEHQRLVYIRSLLDKLLEISTVQCVGIMRAFNNARCMRGAEPFKLAVLHPEQVAQLDAMNDKEVSNKRINTLIRDALNVFSLKFKIKLPDLYGVVYPCIGFFWE